jgi:hypothetical protein
MRLLKRLVRDDFQLVSFKGENVPPYTILSYTWAEGEEVVYHELVAGTGKGKTSYAKLQFCSERAAADGLDYFWVDTCCIDKYTSQELSTAINSMFRWYQHASKCYVYLPDVVISDNIINAEDYPIAWRKRFDAVDGLHENGHCRSWWRLLALSSSLKTASD